MKAWQVSRSFAGADDLEAVGPRPVDLLTNDRGLIAVGEAIDQARGPGPVRQQRAGHHVGLLATRVRELG